MACLGSEDLQTFDLDNNWGRKALAVMYKFMEAGVAVDEK